MKTLVLAALLVIGPATLDPCVSARAAGTCCKTCKAGKACGNSCIAVDKICHQPPGCACNG